MTRIIKAKEMSYEEMLSKGYIYELDKDYKAGSVVNECYVMSGAMFNNPSDDYKKGTYVRAIPLDCIDIVETDADLSSYGFVKSEHSNRWFNTK